MIKIIDNLELFDLPYIENDEVHSLYLSSEGNDSIGSVKRLLEGYSIEYTVIFLASGMLDEIMSLKSFLEDSLICYEEGDAEKFYIKHFPKIVSYLDNPLKVQKVLDSWLCTIYERRIIYVLKKEKTQDFIKQLLLNKNSFESITKQIWPFVHCVVENSLDAPLPNTFIISGRKKEFDDIVKKLKY